MSDNDDWPDADYDPPAPPPPDAALAVIAQKHGLTLGEARDNFNRLMSQIGVRLTPSGSTSDRALEQAEIEAEIARRSAARELPYDAGDKQMVLHKGMTIDEAFELARATNTPVATFTPATPEQLEQIKAATAAYEAQIAAEQYQKRLAMLDDLRALIENSNLRLEGGARMKDESGAEGV